MLIKLLPRNLGENNVPRGKVELASAIHRVTNALVPSCIH